MRIAAIVLALIVVALIVSGCILDELDLTGKACPCNGAYVCDEARNVCVKENAPSNADAALDDRGAGDGDEDPDGGPDDDDDGGPLDVAIPATCTLDSDCGHEDYICEGSRCVRRCGVPEGIECDADEVCNPNNGRCAKGNLELGDDCDFNGQCNSAYCLIVTTSTRAGTQRFCSIPCSSTTDCPSDHSCLNVGGISFCLRETAFSPAATFDTPPGGSCTETENSCQGRTCNLDTSQCIQRCIAEDDCAGYGDNCWTWVDGNYAGICFARAGADPGASCATDTQCRTGVCNRYQGTCAAHCCSEDDCAADESCAVYDFTPTVPVKICRRKLLAGVAPLGAECVTDAECESELCAPTNSNGTGQKYCSVPCCEPTDCAALPGGGFCWPLAGIIPNTLFGTCLPR